jgi:hypothetical protein
VRCAPGIGVDARGVLARLHERQLAERAARDVEASRHAAEAIEEAPRAFGVGHEALRAHVEIEERARLRALEGRHLDHDAGDGLRDRARVRRADDGRGGGEVRREARRADVVEHHRTQELTRLCTEDRVDRGGRCGRRRHASREAERFRDAELEIVAREGVPETALGEPRDDASCAQLARERARDGGLADAHRPDEREHRRPRSEDRAQLREHAASTEEHLGWRRRHEATCSEGADVDVVISGASIQHELRRSEGERLRDTRDGRERRAPLGLDQLEGRARQPRALGQLVPREPELGASRAHTRGVHPQALGSTPLPWRRSRTPHATRMHDPPTVAQAQSVRGPRTWTVVASFGRSGRGAR